MMPAVAAETIDREFDAAVTATAAVDVSSFGRLRATGKDTLDLLHRLSTADLSGLPEGSVQDTLLLTAKGRLVDLVTVWTEAGGARIIVSPGAEEAVTKWIAGLTIMEDVAIHPEGDATSLIYVLGPHAAETVALRMETNPARSVHVPGGDLAEVQTPRWNGFLLAIDTPAFDAIWERLTHSGPAAAVPMGREAFEAFRVARGIPARGAEINEDHGPYDIAAMEAVSFTKGCYVGQEVVARIDTYQKIRRGPSGFLLSEFAGELPVELWSGQQEVGRLTSQAFVHGHWIGLGVVRSTVSEGSVLEVPGRGVQAAVTRLPVHP